MVDVDGQDGLVELNGHVYSWDELNERWDHGYTVLNGAETIYGMKAIHCPGDAVGESGEVIFPAEFESVWWRVDVCSEPVSPDRSDPSSVGKLRAAAKRPSRVWKPVNVFEMADAPCVVLTGEDGRFIACPETAAWAVRRWSRGFGRERHSGEVLRVSGIEVFSDAFGDHSWRQHNGHLLAGEEDVDDIELFVTMENSYTVLAEHIRGLDCTWISRGDAPVHPRNRVNHSGEEIAAKEWIVGNRQRIVGRDGQPLVRGGRRRAGIGL